MRGDMQFMTLTPSKRNTTWIAQETSEETCSSADSARPDRSAHTLLVRSTALPLTPPCPQTLVCENVVMCLSDQGTSFPKRLRQLSEYSLE